MPNGLCLTNEELKFLREALGVVPTRVRIAGVIYDKVIAEQEARHEAAEAEKEQAEKKESDK